MGDELATPPSPASQLAHVRALIARELLDAHAAPLVLGEITLHAHQRRAAARIANLLRAHGGALLADPTGLGKTYVALAAGRDFERVLIICPAALRDVWCHALARIGRAIPVLSLERLRRAQVVLPESPQLLIIDECHHLRNPRTKQYDAVAALSDRAAVLLLSATPVQNCRDDLLAQLALFLGDAAYAMSDVELARLIVRRGVHEISAPLPVLVGPRWITIPVEDDVLDDLMQLPPAVSLADEGEADVLLRYTLLRQWSSSRAALVAALRGRLARGVALITSLDSGSRPTRRELEAWSLVDDAVQLAMPELIVSSQREDTDLWILRVAVECHVAAIRALLDRLRATPDPDPSRADALRELRRQHEGARLIAFSQYAHTVRQLSRMLMSTEAGVAELTSRGGRVAGGRVSRAEVLAQFAPSARVWPTSERIDLLITTDVSSEGLDLQGASVVVHLDLPWNPGRLEQRVGRIRRLAGRHERVFVYALAPPARSERVLGIEARLRAKMRVAARLVGISPRNLPNGESGASDAPPALTSGLYALLENWRDSLDLEMRREAARATCAAVSGARSGFLALLLDGEERLLLADLAEGPTLDPRAVNEAAALLFGKPVEPRPEEVARVRTAIAEWWTQRVVRQAIRPTSTRGAQLRARLARRITTLLADSPRHARAELARAVCQARCTLAVPLGIGAERRLAALAEAPLADAQWLERLAELGGNRVRHAPDGEPRIAGLVLIQPEN